VITLFILKPLKVLASWAVHWCPHATPLVCAAINTRGARRQPPFRSVGTAPVMIRIQNRMPPNGRFQIRARDRWKVYCPWLNCMAHKAQGTVSYQCSICFQHVRKIWCIPVAGTGSFVCLGARRADVVSPRTKDFSMFLLSSFNFEKHDISTLGQQSLFLIWKYKSLIGHLDVYVSFQWLLATPKR
jgi:hypothetical protein